ncbi:hypothetical protein MTR_3g073880 [Medicago truncatula]|uniref:Uncharacterized protein n=1 Tax=Medicago truncatula TaxID=3880 RepID=G8A396_MEDTR|nr:hypothetical protein MTR_3g073880 [Medicago truncatula]
MASMFRLKIGHLDPKLNWKLQNSNHQRRGVQFLNLLGKNNAVSIVSNPSHSDKLRPISCVSVSVSVSGVRAS